MSDTQLRLITASDIDLTTLKIEDNKLKVNVENVVPAAKADRFLKAVTYNEQDKNLEFAVTAAEENAEDTMFKVPVADFLKGLATLEKLKELEDKISALENKPDYELTTEKLTTAITAGGDEVKTAIRDLIKGEEALNVAGEAKGFFIKAD